MATKKKFDAVVEAVRYAADGQVLMVRVHQRMGAAFTDLILLQRDELAARLRAGLHFVTGKRRENMGATFDTGPEIRLVKAGGHELIRSTQAQPGERDDLQGAPRF